MTDRRRLHDEYEPEAYDDGLQPDDVADVAPPFPDLGEPQTLVGDRPINAGAAKAYLEGRILPDGEAMTEPQIERELSFDAIDRMMREVYVPLGGRGSGGGKGKENRLSFRPAQPVDESGEDAAVTGLRLHVAGLTPGERAFYERRSGEARAVLREHVGKLIADAVPIEREVRAARDAARGMWVYGLTQEEIDVLRVRPGSARRALADHARGIDGERVNALDRGLA